MTLFERVLIAQGFDIPRAYSEIEEKSNLSRDGLDAWCNGQKLAIAKFHFDNNPLYKSKTGKLFPPHWADLPVMEKSDFQQDLRSILSSGLKLRHVYKASTSGSSGHPLVFAKDKYTHACTWALIKQRYAWHRLSLGAKQARFYGIPLEPRQHAIEKMKDRLMNRVRFPVFDLSDEVLSTYALHFQQIPFEYVYGYTNSLVLFARFLLRNNVRLSALCPTLRICITTSEICTEEDRNILQEAFGVRTVNEYGASEVGLISFENANGEWIISEENIFVEIVDDEYRPLNDGVHGHVLITDLRNRALPFVRYNLGDIGTIKPEGPTQRNPRKVFLRLEGRENDTIVLPSGKVSPGLTFYYISRSVLEATGNLREFIIRQTAIDEFTFDVVSERPLSREEEKLIQAKMDLYLEPGLKFKVHRVSAIRRPASGKIKHFYSEVN